MAVAAAAARLSRGPTVERAGRSLDNRKAAARYKRAMTVRSTPLISAAAMATFLAVYALAPGADGTTGIQASGAAPASAVSQTSAPPIYYSGCNEARAAGVTPIYRGQAGYREGMDGDSDGIACEPYRGY
jgi:hypothetical protein